MQRSTIPFLITLSTLSALGVGLLGPIYPIFVVNRFSASLVDVGALYAVFSATAALFKIPSGRLTDMYGRKKIFLFGILISAMCSLSYIFASDLIQLYVIDFFFGVSYALRSPALLALTTDLSDKENKGLFLGLFESAYDITGAIAAVLSVVIVGRFGFESLFFICFGCQATAGIFVLRSTNVPC